MSNKVKVVRTNRRDLGGIDFRKIAQKSEILEFTCLQVQTYDLWYMTLSLSVTCFLMLINQWKGRSWQSPPSSFFCRKENRNEPKVHFEPQKWRWDLKMMFLFQLGDFLGSKCEISGGVSWWWKLTFKKKQLIRGRLSSPRKISTKNG